MHKTNRITQRVLGGAIFASLLVCPVTVAQDMDAPVTLPQAMASTSSKSASGGGSSSSGQSPSPASANATRLPPVIIAAKVDPGGTLKYGDPPNGVGLLLPNAVFQGPAGFDVTTPEGLVGASPDTSLNVHDGAEVIVQHREADLLLGGEFDLTDDVPMLIESGSFDSAFAFLLIGDPGSSGELYVVDRAMVLPLTGGTLDLCQIVDTLGQYEVLKGKIAQVVLVSNLVPDPHVSAAEIELTATFEIAPRTKISVDTSP